MLTQRAVIRNGEVVTPDGLVRASLLIEDGAIARIGEVAEGPTDEDYDATGMLVIPGAVDVHTHLDMEVGVTRSSDDFATGTIAAACGGTTTVVDFATTYRGESVAQGLRNWHEKARGRAAVDYAFHMSLTELRQPAEEIVAEMAAEGITSFKLYMTYPERLMVSDDVILDVMKAAGKSGALVCLHCEDDVTVTELRREALAAGRTDPAAHAWSRPPSAEADAVTRAARMAEEAGAACYVVHLSSAPGLEQVRLARERGVPFYAETCPQYLYLNAERYEGAPDEAIRYVCAPPLRDAWHNEELWEGLERGHLQIVSTDHCPFELESKRAGLAGGGWKDFTEIPGGLPGVETRLSLIYQRVIEGEIPIERWVEMCCTNPAKMFGLYPRKGVLRVGSDADVVVFDPRAVVPLVPERLHMRVDYSVYEDITVTGWPALVFSRGTLVAKAGVPLGTPGWGRFVARGPSGSPEGS